ncbi:hypothetical protein [Aeromicrobium fastidiosum]|uniref:Uncharacterized protein n=1 Tax=Aeromicrobium fastidiosum TaxID=52699 RepID=A0A641AM16_9ACTN|nr:hypothetical protein [Aeromicrobium fastidiosum]KAA1376443.1 hypothetical protein ESP62_013535 [Aeromicrobium fastidiosum]MBP2391642.1 hypothetical protein [Aeromicrobium fastidiosum]
MVDAHETPAYPPAHSTWQFAPPARRNSRRRTAALVALGVVLAVVAAGSVAGIITIGVAIAQSTSPTTIDDDALTQTIAEECVVMESTVESMPVYGTAQQQSDAIRDQNRAVEVMIAAIRSKRADEILADPPADQWLDDWQSLVDARAELADELLSDPNASLVVPVDRAGDPITDRMDDVWPFVPTCTVPVALTAPDADALSG